MISKYFYERETDTMWIYKKITVAELLYWKSKYTHVEVREEGKKGRW